MKGIQGHFTKITNPKIFLVKAHRQQKQYVTENFCFQLQDPLFHVYTFCTFFYEILKVLITQWKLHIKSTVYHTTADVTSQKNKKSNN